MGREELPRGHHLRLHRPRRAATGPARVGRERSDQECERALQFFLSHYNEHKLDNTCAYPGVAEALEHLSAYPMAVLTNKPVRVSVRILEGLGLAQYFRAVYGGNSFETKKTGPAWRQHDSARIRCLSKRSDPHRDSEVDVQTARNAERWPPP